MILILKLCRNIVDCSLFLFLDFAFLIYMESSLPLLMRHDNLSKNSLAFLFFVGTCL